MEPETELNECLKVGITEKLNLELTEEYAPVQNSLTASSNLASIPDKVQEEFLDVC